MNRLSSAGPASRPRSIFVLSVALAALALPASATSATKYRYADQTVPASGTAEATASCGGGAQVIGGGAYMRRGTTATRIRLTAPIDSPGNDKTNDDGWAAAGNADEVGDEVTAIAVCSDERRFRYVSSKPRPVTSARSARVGCPKKHRVVGGGIEVQRNFASPLVSLVESEPVGAGTGMSKDDGWRGRVNNASGGSPKLKAWAICARNVRTVGRTVSDSIGGQSQDQFTTPRCPGGFEVTGGGGSVTGTPGGIYFATTEPYALDGDGRPDDAWRTIFSNASEFTQSIVVESVCTKF